jgi:hypothetical protein
VILFVHDVLNHLLIHFSGIMLKAFFNNIAAKLLPRKLNDITHQLSADNNVNLFDFHL